MNLLKKFIMFCGVGVVAFAIDWVVFNIFYGFTNLFVISLGFGWIVSMIFNFGMNRNVTFNARRRSIPKQVLKWAIVYILAFFARISVGHGTLIIIGNGVVNANIAYFAGILVMIPISFLGSLLWVFNKR